MTLDSSPIADRPPLAGLNGTNSPQEAPTPRARKAKQFQCYGTEADVALVSEASRDERLMALLKAPTREKGQKRQGLDAGAAALKLLGVHRKPDGLLGWPTSLSSVEEVESLQQQLAEAEAKLATAQAASAACIEAMKRSQAGVLEANQLREAAAASLHAADERGQQLKAQLAKAQALAGKAGQLAGQLEQTEALSEQRRKAKECYRRQNLRSLEREEALKEMLPLSERWDEQFRHIVAGRVPPEQKHLKALWDDQMRCLKNKSHKCRWHPEILEWAAKIYRTDARAYEQFWAGGVIKAPHPDHVRKYCASANGTPDNDGRLKALAATAKDFSRRERQVVLKFDEVNCTGELTWKLKDGEYEFFGFADELEAQQLFVRPRKDGETVQEAATATLATHCLFVQVESLGRSSFRHVAAIYPVRNLTASKIDALFWSLVEKLQRICGLQVKAVVCDGAGANRLFIKMNTTGCGKGTPNEFGQAFCRNRVAPSKGKIWFVPDISHFLKKARNNFSSSHCAGGTRNMYIPKVLANFILDQVPFGIEARALASDDDELEPPPAQESPEYTPIAQLAQETEGEETYIIVMGRLYELMTDPMPYYAGSVAREPRILELQFLLKWVKAWHRYNAVLQPGGPVDSADRGRWGLSHQLFFDLQCMVEGFVGLVDDLLQEHGSLALLASPTLNQDTLESLFGLLRYNAGGGRDVSVFKLMHGAGAAEKHKRDCKELRSRLKKRNADPDAAQQPSYKRAKKGAILPAPPGTQPLPRWGLREPAGFDRACAAMLAEACVPGHRVRPTLPVSWQTLRRIQAWDEDSHQMKLMHWLTARHFNLSSYEKMNVGLAKGVLQLPTARMLHFMRVWAKELYRLFAKSRNRSLKSFGCFEFHS